MSRRVWWFWLVLLFVNAGILLWGLLANRDFQMVSGGTGVIMAVITLLTCEDRQHGQ